MAGGSARTVATGPWMPEAGPFNRGGGAARGGGGTRGSDAVGPGGAPRLTGAEPEPLAERTVAAAAATAAGTAADGPAAAGPLADGRAVAPSLHVVERRLVEARFATRGSHQLDIDDIALLVHQDAQLDRALDALPLGDGRIVQRRRGLGDRGDHARVGQAHEGTGLEGGGDGCRHGGHGRGR